MSNLSRSQRVDRSANLVMASMGFGAVFVVTLVLAIAGVMGATIPVLALIVGVVLALLARRSVR
jgi:hypothetical protein